MFQLWSAVQVKADRVEEFLAGMREHAARCVEHEPGCLGFQVVELDAHERRYAYLETYTDRAAFEDDHVNSPHFGFYRELAARVLVGDGRLETGDVIIDGAR